MTGPFSARLTALMQAAAGALDAGDDAAAEPLFRHIVAENPRDADAWHMLAALAIRAGRGGEAIESALRAHQLDRRNHLYLNTLGVAHAEAQQLDEAVRWFKRALKERPSHAESHYNLGKVYRKLGQLAESERCYLRARQLDPESAQIANNLAVLYSRQGRYADAVPLLAQARARMPDEETVAINSAIAALATSGADAAIRGLADFAQRRPDSAAVREELATRLLAEGRFAEGWRQYAWRRNRPRAARVPELRARRVLLLPEQGLGDQLFFLRFAARLRERAAFVAFDCPTKLWPLLERSDIIDELCAGEGARSSFEIELPVGDLPELLEDWTTPPAFAIAAPRGAAWRERLAALGPAPYLGVTWRGGTKRDKDVEFARHGQEPLYKDIAIEPLAATLRKWRGTVLVLQRLPLPAELELFCRSLGRQAHNLSALNDDLEDMAAVLSLIDEYVGVSNTNMHIRAGLGKTARVLVPFPPEFRWMHAGEAAPWFPGFTVYRQSPQREWAAALDKLQQDITS